MLTRVFRSVFAVALLAASVACGVKADPLPPRDAPARTQAAASEPAPAESGASGQATAPSDPKKKKSP